MLRGKVAVVTGASRGLGKRIAQALAGEGAQLVLTARRAPPNAHSPLEEVAAGIRSAGGAASAVHCDVADEQDVRALVAETLRRHGRLDILVNNAASRLATKLLDTSPADLEGIIRTNVLGPFLLWRAAIPAMIAGGGGNVINLISTNAPRQPFIGMAPYRMTKAALTFLSVDLAQELEGEGVAVNAFDPGPIVSEGTAAIREARERRYGVRIPYHAQDPVEVLDAPIRWLADQTASTFTGNVVRRVDFGKTWGPGLDVQATART